MSENSWHADFLASFVGRKIVQIRPMMAEEIESMTWYDQPGATVVIEFDDGRAWMPMQDPEGNGAGFIEVLDNED